MKRYGLLRLVTGSALLFAATFVLCAAIGAGTTQQAAFPEIIGVNSTGDGDDAFAGDGQCETAVGNGVCTLRAAIEEANAHAGSDGVFFSIPTTDPGYSNGRWTINLSRALPNISDGVNINGPGADKLTVQNPNPQQTPFRIFNVTASGTVNISGMTMSNGRVANDNGGSIQNFNAATVNVTSCVVRSDGNMYLAVDGGGIYNRGGGVINITNCNFFQVAATGNGAAICNSSTGAISVKGSTLDDCSASYGGGIFNNGTMIVVNTVVTISGALNGGGIYNNGTLNLSNSLVWGNNAHSGGGIYNASFATASVTDSTLYFNTSDLQNGGGIYNQGTLNVSNSTLDLNLAGSFTDQGASGGGIYNDSQATGNATVKSTIIARSAANCNNQFPSCANISDVAGFFISQGFNLIGSSDGSTGFTAATDITGTSSFPVDPGLDSNGLNLNGGPTETIALLSGSPAIDKGSSTTVGGVHLIVDQRGVGYARTVNKAVANATGGDGTDIGAFEFGAQIKAVSRKQHGTAGTFDINLPLLKLGIECRKGGTSGIFKAILTFPKAVTVGSTSVTLDPKTSSPTGSVSSVSFSGRQVTVNLTGVSNAQTLRINLSGVSDGVNTNDISVPMGVLFGDTNKNGFVTSADATLTQSKIGQTVNGSNFREDVSLDGSINSTDVQQVQSKVGTKLP
jgi:CSLREA domain-containing protein